MHKTSVQGDMKCEYEEKWKQGYTEPENKETSYISRESQPMFGWEMRRMLWMQLCFSSAASAGIQVVVGVPEAGRGSS